MRLASQLQQYGIVVFASFMSAIIILCIVLVYLLKVKKVTAKEEKVDYSRFNKTNILDYLRFDDIIEGGTEGNSFGVIKHGNVFTAGIDIIGYNFAEATAEEQKSTMIKAISFANIIKGDIQLRQSVTAIQLSDNIDEYNKIYKELDAKLVELDSEYQQVKRQVDDHIDDEPEILAMYCDHLEALRAKIKTVDWQARECNTLIEVMQLLQGKGKESRRNNQLIFSYTYNPNEYTEVEDEQGIALRAIHELRTMAESYSNALVRCGCKCHVLSAKEIARSTYEHMHPFENHSERFDEDLDRALNSLFITSDSLAEYEKRRLGELAYIEMMQEYENKSRELIKRNDLEHMRMMRNEYVKAGMNIPDEL